MTVKFEETQVGDLLRYDIHGDTYTVLAVDVDSKSLWIRGDKGTVPFTVHLSLDRYTKVTPKFEVGKKYKRNLSHHESDLVYECVKIGEDVAYLLYYVTTDGAVGAGRVPHKDLKHFSLVGDE